MYAALTIHETGPLTTVQDLGRLGQGGFGVPMSGASDRASFRLANALVGNLEGAAVLEVTDGGLVLEAHRDLVLAVTGARCTGVALDCPFGLRAGSVLRLGRPSIGLRSYVAVRGGVDVPAVLGSRSTDQLSGLGPPPLRPGARLAVGTEHGAMPGVDVAPVWNLPAGRVDVRVAPGPRRDWFTDASWELFLTQEYILTPDTNRVGARLQGRPLHRSREGELASEGMLRGAVQVPPSGLPVVFLSDHPVTGGYPVIAYVLEEDVDRCAQLRPGQPVRFRPHDPSAPTSPAL